MSDLFFPPKASSSGGTVTSVAAAGAGITIAGTPTDPTVATSAATNASLALADSSVQPAGDLGGTGAAPSVLKARGGALPDPSAGTNKSLVLSAANTYALQYRGAQLDFFATALSGTTGVQRWLTPHWTAVASSEGTINRRIAPCAGILVALGVRHVAGTGAANVVYTVQINGVDGTMTVTLDNATSQFLQDLAHTITVAAGDGVGVAANRAGGSSAPTTASASLLFIPLL